MINTDLEVENNLGLVHLCANRFKGKGIEYEELYSAGCIGLLKAAKAFDENRGVKFSTYAVPVILGEIKRLFRDGGTIKVSRSVKELSLKVARERERVIKLKGREPLISELSSALDADESQIIEALSVSQPLISLTDSGEDSDGQIDIRVEAPDEEISDLISLRQIMDTLEKNDRMLLYFRYYKNLTQNDGKSAWNDAGTGIKEEKKLLLSMREQLLE